MSLNVIADIAGEFDTLQALLAKMPPGDPVSIGDMVDRGPKSKEVLDFFMKNGHAILGNHEHMMLDYCKNTRMYQHGIWQMNGGGATQDSFPDYLISEEYTKWLLDLPLSLEVQDKSGNLILLSHAFLHPMFKNIEEGCQAAEKSPYSVEGENSVLWNRGYPIPRPEYKLQVCGHNSQYGLRWISDEKDPDSEPFALCLDDSRRRKLTGIHIPTMEIFQQEYI